MKAFALVLLLVSAPAFAEDAMWKPSVVVDCRWMGGYLGGVAALRNRGDTEAEVKATLDELAHPPAKKIDPALRRHIESYVGFLFEHADWTPQMIYDAYVDLCGTWTNGRIPENDDADI
jgi:hypothetical protein